jgi:hypothetical protein
VDILISIAMGMYDARSSINAADPTVGAIRDRPDAAVGRIRSDATA